MSRNLVLFDGVCVFCNNFVLFLIKRDKKNLLIFTPQDKEVALEISRKYNLDYKKIDAIVYLRDYNTSKESIYFASTAVLNIFKDINYFKSIFVIGSILPVFLRDFIYTIFARIRYKVFGKYDTCLLPIEGLKSKFI